MSKGQRNCTEFYLVEPIEGEYCEVDAPKETVKKHEKDSESFNHVYMFTENNIGLKSRGPHQNYGELLAYHIKNKTLFNDDLFQPKKIDLGDDISGPVEWKRPFEIVSNPQFIIDGATRFDVEQGQIGDCWFLAAVANLTINRKIFEFVVPKEQSFSRNYAGIFHFRFWQYGKWVDVVIDDRLPTVKGKLIFLQSDEKREFWTPLLEKAYAKLYGSYRNINGGQINEALEDLCGGLSETYEASHWNLFDIMWMSYQRSSFMGCSIISREVEGRRPDGLVTMHAYSITKMETVPLGEAQTKLLRIRNPWGEIEWNGPWSDDSQEWELVTRDVKTQLLTQREDGEFWMEFTDFQERFSFLDICHLNPNALFHHKNVERKWHVSNFDGAWVLNVTAGGGIRNIETFACNPQYIISIKGDKTRKHAVVLGLLQKYRRSLGVDELPLELAVYSVNTPPGQLLDTEFFKANKPIRSTRSDTRQLTMRFHLPPGKYCVIPSTMAPNKHAEYLLRIYTETEGDVTENDDEVGYNMVKTNIESKQQVVRMVDNTFPRLFKKIAGDEQEVGWEKVRKALNKIYKKPAPICFIKPKKVFTENACQNIVTLWDQNYSGKLGYEEFWQLMRDVAVFNTIFKKYDTDKSGGLNGFELRDLLSECGYTVNKQVLNAIMLRYGTNDGSMRFENFVLCALKLKAMIDEYHRRKPVHVEDGISLNKRDWLQTTLYS